jgi:hypothetical protein
MRCQQLYRSQCIGSDYNILIIEPDVQAMFKMFNFAIDPDSKCSKYSTPINMLPFHKNESGAKS